MTKQIMKMIVPYNGTWRIIQDDASYYNQFSVYHESDGHKKLLQRYGDMASCLHFITQQLTGYVWYMSDQKVERVY